jgi:hypothetical protein
MRGASEAAQLQIVPGTRELIATRRASVTILCAANRLCQNSLPVPRTVSARQRHLVSPDGVPHGITNRHDDDPEN